MGKKRVGFQRNPSRFLCLQHKSLSGRHLRISVTSRVCYHKFEKKQKMNSKYKTKKKKSQQVLKISGKRSSDRCVAPGVAKAIISARRESIGESRERSPSTGLQLTIILLLRRSLLRSYPRRSLETAPLH